MKLIKNEMYKVFKLNKLYFFIIIAMALLMVSAVSYSSDSSYSVNGQSFPIWMINRIMPLFIFFMSLLLAEIISDEYRNGTLKLFLLHPIDRIGLLNAKIAALIVSVFILLLSVMAGSYIIGTAFWGWGDKMVFNNTVFQTTQGILVTLQSYIITLLPCLGFGMVIVFVSVLSSSMGGTLGISLGIMFVLTALENVQEINNYSIVHQMNLYQSFISNPQSENIIIGLVNVAVYTVIFYIGSVIAFKKKDILT